TAVAVTVRDNEALFVDELYRRLLDRTADPGGRSFWIRTLAAGADRGVVAAVFANSAEGRGVLVDDLYQAILHRAADPAGRAAAVQALLAGLSEADLAVILATSPEYTATHRDDASFVVGLFRDFLGREPTVGDVQSGVQALQSGLRSRATLAYQVLS